MKLDDCAEINIHGKDVQRITMKGNIVWEKQTPMDTPILTMITGDLYQGWWTACKLTDSQGNPLSNKTVTISVAKNNGTTYEPYEVTTDNNGKGKLQMNWLPQKVGVKYIFNGDSQYNPVTLSKTFTIKNPLTQSKCAGSMTSGGSTGSYREWVDVYSDCNDNYCRCTNIATSSGTHKIPALLRGEVNFSIPAGAKVTNLKADWKSKRVKYSSSGGYASIGAPTVSVHNDGSGVAHSKTAGAPGKNTYVSGTFNYSGSTTNGLNDGVIVKVQFPANTSGEIGQIYFVGVKLTATYIPKQGTI